MAVSRDLKNMAARPAEFWRKSNLERARAKVLRHEHVWGSGENMSSERKWEVVRYAELCGPL